MTALVIRDARTEDLGGVAAVHMQAFSDSVLARLGAEAVRRNYLWQLDGPHDVDALVALDGDTVVGFMFGGVFRGSTIGFVKSQRWFLLGRVLRNPAILLGSIGWNRVVLGTRLLLRRWPNAQPEKPDGVPPRSYGVLSIAVDPTTQGSGIGGQLLSEATARAVAAGFEAMHLTVHPDNGAATGFYRSLGWTEMPEPDGSWKGRMSIALSAPEM